jgi:zinc transporter ZupT
MTPILLALGTFISTMSGGIFALKNKQRLHYILGFTAGVILGVIAFDILPETFRLAQQYHVDTIKPMVALVCGFLAFHILEKTVLIHHAHEHEYGNHKHPQVGVMSALALSGHSLLDGIGIGLGFQINSTVGVAVAIAVIGHDFADGLNTVSLMLNNKNTARRSFMLLVVDALAPVVGVASTFFFHLSEANLVLYLGFFAGFLLYIGAADILPQAHEESSSRITIGLTVAGAAFMFIITRFV